MNEGASLLTAAPARGKGAAAFRTPLEVTPLANPELGAKQVCPNCQAKFYDLGKRPAHCPKCHTEFDPEEALRSRRVRGRSAAPEHEAEVEEEDQVVDKEVEADEEEDDAEATPEVDVGVDDEPPLSTDDDDDDAAGPAGSPDDGMSEFTEDDEVTEDDDDDVPFLEDEDDDDSFEEEIDGLPGEGDDDDR